MRERAYITGFNSTGVSTELMGFNATTLTRAWNTRRRGHVTTTTPSHANDDDDDNSCSCQRQLEQQTRDKEGSPILVVTISTLISRFRRDKLDADNGGERQGQRNKFVDRPEPGAAKPRLKEGEESDSEG